MGRVAVVGGSLPGLAAAARLAKVGHSVVLHEARPVLGGRWAEPGVLPDVLDFPAPWRDLFKKSGRPLSAELARAGLDLVPAPDAVVVLGAASWFDRGPERLSWPTDRAAQWHLLVAEFGEKVARGWRDLVDEQDAVWLALRPLGLEGELTSRHQALDAGLHPTRTLADVARGVPNRRLRRLVTDVASGLGGEPDAVPAWLASRLSVTRTFGRWVLVEVDEPEVGVPMTRLLELLIERVRLRRVEVRLGSPVAEGAGPADLDADAVVWTVAGPDAERPHWRRPRRGDDFVDQLMGRRLIRKEKAPCSFHASAASPGGPEPWAQLLSAALAVYACHETLTEQDIRPTNKALKQD